MFYFILVLQSLNIYLYHWS